MKGSGRDGEGNGNGKIEGKGKGKGNEKENGSALTTVSKARNARKEWSVSSELRL